MIKKAVIASIIIIGAGLVFSQLLQSGAGPKATFPLNGEQLIWLTSQSDLTLDLEESGARNVESAPTACYAKRTLSFDADGTASIRQTCADDESWRVIYRDGTLEFENEAHTTRWFVRPNGNRSPDEFLQALDSAQAS